MDFNLTEEQIAFQNSVRSLADKYLKEGNLRRAHDPLFPKDIGLSIEPVETITSPALI